MKILSEGNVFREFDGVRVSRCPFIIELYFEDETLLLVSPDHKIHSKDGYVEAKNAKIGDYYTSINGDVRLIYKHKNLNAEDVYDPVEVKETHNYVANGLLSHQCVYLDEFAFVQNDVEFFTSTYPVITSGTQTKIIITSTPNGMNLFYKLYTDAINSKNDFKPIKYIWNKHPHRDEAWKRETIRNTSEKQFRQEHQCEFLGSSNTLISGECLERLVFKEPIYSDDYNNLYYKPQPDHTYVCFVDVGEGAGRDYSVVNVIDITDKPYHQVYVYRRNDLSPWLLTPIVIDIAMKYNQAYIQVENNSVGKIVADTIFFEYDYENTISSKMFKGEEKFAEYTTHGLGVRMDKKSKIMGCSALKTLLEENLLIVEDWTTIQELSWFIKTRTSYEAEKGKTDDIAMSLVHFGWLSIQTFFENLSKPGIFELMKDVNDKYEDQKVTAFGFFSDGTEDDFSSIRM